MSTCAVVVCGFSFDVNEFVRALHTKHPYTIISSKRVTVRDAQENYEARLRFKKQTTSEDIFLLAQKYKDVNVGACECSELTA